ncbi:Ig-like domain-containing protein, partial [Lacticaseibacillus sp. GG6-2]
MFGKGKRSGTLRLETDRKQRYKMYKSGKMWAIAGLVTTYFTVLAIGQGNLVHADTNSSSQISVSQVLQATQASGQAATPAAASQETPAATTTQQSAPAAAATTQAAPAQQAPAAQQVNGAPKSDPVAPTLAQPTKTFQDGKAILEGSAEAGATITAEANGQEEGSTTVTSTGTYRITVKAGEQVTLTETTVDGQTATVTVDIPAAPAADQPNTNPDDLNATTTDATGGVKDQLNNGGGLAQGALFNDTAQGADNTATPNLGDQKTAEAAVTAANKQEAEKKDSGYVKTASSEEQDPANNDDWDEGIITVDGTVVSGPVPKPATDFYSNQGALSSAYTDHDMDGTETIVDTPRFVDLHSQISNTGIAGRLIGGDTANSAVFKVAEDLRDLKVGTWTVVSVSNAGVTVRNDNTGEFYAITDNSNNTTTLKVGDKIDGKAVVHTLYTGGIIENVSDFITTTIGQLLTVPEQIANAAASGVGGVLASAMQTVTKDDAYAEGLAAAKAAVDNDVAMEHYLMDNGVRISTLEDVKQEGNVLTVTNDTNAADAIGNMVSGFFQGWVNDIKDYGLAFFGLLPGDDGSTALGKIPLVGSVAEGMAKPMLDGILKGIDDLPVKIIQEVKDALTGAVDTAGDASFGASQSVVVPISFNDPDFKQSILTEDMDPAFADGKFKAETIGVSANLFRQTDDTTPDYTTSTTIAYQIVNKTALDQYVTEIQKDPALTTKAGDDLQTALYILQDQDPATEGKSAKTASQKDVDGIVKKLEDKLETVPELTSADITGDATKGYTVTGEGTKGADVMITDPAGNIVGQGKIGDDGKYSIPVDASVPAGTILTVTPSLKGLTNVPVSGETKTVTVPTVEMKSETPTDVTATGQEDGSTEVTGTGTPGATVEVKNPDGKVVGTGTVGDDGKFDVTVPKDKAKPGVPLSVTQTEPGKDPSDATTVTVTAPEQTKSETPTGVAATGQEDGSTEVTGTGTPGATVEVKNPDGKVVGTGTVGDDGKFDVTVPKDDAKPGVPLSVTQTEPGKDPSDATTVTVTTPEQTKSETPTGVTATGQEDGSTEVTGTGTPGATVEVKNPDGKVVGTGTVGDDG